MADYHRIEYGKFHGRKKLYLMASSASFITTRVRSRGNSVCGSGICLCYIVGVRKAKNSQKLFQKVQVTVTAPRLWDVVHQTNKK